MYKLLGILLCISLATISLHAQWGEQQKLLAREGESGDYLGESVDISDNHIIVGAFNASGPDIQSGAAYVFFWDGTRWIEQDILTASDGEWRDRFGFSVAISGKYAIVGAYSNNEWATDTGAAYVFEHSGYSWDQQVKLYGDNIYNANFGYSVDICGDFAIVGAPEDDGVEEMSGAAYIFHRDEVTNTWSEQVKLVASDGEEDDTFGRYVSIDGDYAIVGASADDDCGEQAGAAYLFHHIGDTWVEHSKLLPPLDSDGVYFGCAVSISGSYAIVGAHTDDDNGIDTGAAYIFHHATTGWEQTVKLAVSDVSDYGIFGHKVAIYGDYALVGAEATDNNGLFHSGAAYLFHREGEQWPLHTILSSSDLASCDDFGSAVALSEGIAVVGATQDDDNGASTGAAYTFSDPTDIDPDTLTSPPLPLSCYPNPVRGGETTVRFSLAQAGPVEAAVFNIRGQRVAMLSSGRSFKSGEHTLRWDATDQATGVYLVRLSTPYTVTTAKLLRIR